MSTRRTSDTLEMLLLSILSNGEPYSGYEISAILAEPIPLMWPVKHSQIYPALALLEQRGDISGEWIAQNSRPNKKSYVISSSGLERLQKWLLTARSLFTQDEIRLIVYNLHLLGRTPVLDALSAYRKQCLIEKRHLEDRWLEVWKYPWATMAQQERLTGIRSLYEHAFAVRDGYITWCDEVLKRAAEAVEHGCPANQASDRKST